GLVALQDRGVISGRGGRLPTDRSLARLVVRMVVAVGGVQTEAVVAVLSAHGAEGFPSMAGMLWNVGLLPGSAVHRLVHGMRSPLPVVCTDLGTYDTARAAADARGRVYSGSGRKVETALSLMEKHVDTEQLLDRLRVDRPDVMTPQMFEY